MQKEIAGLELGFGRNGINFKEFDEFVKKHQSMLRPTYIIQAAMTVGENSAMVLFLFF
jgi:hypothetical protein